VEKSMFRKQRKINVYKFHGVTAITVCTVH